MKLEFARIISVYKYELTYNMIVKKLNVIRLRFYIKHKYLNDFIKNLFKFV